MASTTPTTADVVIVGAGPAGSAAAITAARAGRSVVVIDKATFPREKCCGDGLTTLALREVEALGLRPQSIANWHTVTDVVLRSPSGRLVELSLPSTGIYAATTPRAELDAALVDVATSAGATVLSGHRLSGIAHTADGLNIEAESDGRTVQLQAGTLIAADGMWSATRKLLGLNEPGYLGEWHAMRQYATVTADAAQRMYVWFEADLLPGYAWSFPLPGGRANIGFGIRRDGTRPTKEMGALWSDLLARRHIAEALGQVTWEDRVSAWPIPAAITRATLSHDRVLFVGDAARATDVMTGEGIGQALVSGRLAAEALSAGAAPEQVAQHYERAVRRELFADHRMSSVLSQTLAHRRATTAALRIVDLSGWTRNNFARWMFEDEPRALPFRPRHWHRSTLRRPGAYASADR